MATEQTTGEATSHHGGRLVAKRLKAHGVSKLFTLSGGHIFSIYDGCREEGIDIVDTRHEQTAAFAAEGWAKATRQTGVAALTAGPGVTNAMSALGSSLQNGSPVVALGGRAPAMRWGQGSLQEIDHVPFVAPLTRSAHTVDSTADIPGSVDAAFAAAAGPPSGPAFVDFPLDHVFMESDVDADGPAEALDHRALPAADGTERAIELLRGAERPVIMAGTGLYWAHGEDSLRALAEESLAPVFVNGLGRGCLPADHELFFSRARGKGLKEADVAIVVGVPMDFRLGFGQSFGEDTQIVLLDSAQTDRRPPRDATVELYGGIPATLDALRSGAGSAPDGRRGWVESLRTLEDERRGAEIEELNDDRAPLHPLRLYHELKSVLDRDAVVIGDGGDFVSYAGRIIDTYQPGCWMDPGPFGCLGAGPGYALAAKIANPDRQVCLLLGDGAFGFAGMEFDTLVRHNIPVVAVMGNNGIWALEKHPMEFLYGYSVAADLQPECRYDQVVEALGGHGELVREPGELRPALERAFASGKPALVNVLTDPSVVYPRKSNLA
ncbi:MAG: acetolactate synthase [Thermoleophilaceae bacterium]